jgi:small subunit ribosomal protein S18
MAQSLHPMQTGLQGQQKKKNTKTKKVNPIKGQKFVDHLDIKFLGKFTNDQGKILPRRITGVTSTQQKAITRSIKYARHLALMPFVAQDIN